MIDAANAFGAPAHAVILESLKNFCTDLTFDWFVSFLSNRQFYVQKNDERSKLRSLPDRGVPQGSGTGPVCFSRVFNEVLVNIKEQFKNISVIAYADDLSILVSGDTEVEVTNQISECFEAMDKELSKKHIKIAEQKTVGFKVGKWSDNPLKIRNKTINCEDSILYLGLRLGKNVINGDIDIEPQLHHILKRMKSATHNVLAMRDYGTVKQLVNLYNSFAVGFFSHGLDCQGILDKKWYSLFQNEYCNFLKIITHKTYREIGRPISHSELLMPYNLRNFFNTHLYLGINRLNSVFMTSKPTPLFNDLIDCLKSNQGRVIQPYTGFIETDMEFANRVKRRDFYYLQNIGQYSVRMQNSPFLEKELNKLQFENEPETGKKYPRKLYNEFVKLANKIWPICFIKHFNEIPCRIRSMFGTFEFKKELKIYFNNKCQHPYDPNRKFCKKCMPNESDEYKNLLSEKRILHKLATNQNEKSQFFGSKTVMKCLF